MKFPLWYDPPPSGQIIEEVSKDGGKTWLFVRAVSVPCQKTDKRLKDLEKRLDLLRMARVFESPEEKQARADLLKLRNQDWKLL